MVPLRAHRSSRSILTTVLCVVALVAYTIVVANITKLYTRTSRGTPLVRDSLGAAQATDNEGDHVLALKDTTNGKEDTSLSPTEFVSWSFNRSALGGLMCPHRGSFRAECSGHGSCDESAMACACATGFSGAACDVDLRKVPEVLAAFVAAKQREDAAASAGSESQSTSNALVNRNHVASLITVVVPVWAGATHAGGDVASLLPEQWRKQLIGSIRKMYPGIIVQEQPMKGEPSGAGGVATAWNAGLATVSTPWTLLLSPATIAFHDQTNLELMLTLLLSSDVDVLGFATLTPATSEATGEILQPSSQTKPSGADGPSLKGVAGGTPSGREEFVYHADCWNFHGPERWTLAHEKPLFGYHRHAASYAVVCDRSSDSFVVRTPTAQSGSNPLLLFNSSMEVAAVTDFYLRMKRNGAVVATCVECLLKTRLESPFSPATRNGRGDSTGFETWGSAHVILPPPWRLTSVISPGFAELYQVEAVVGPHRLDVPLHKKFLAVPRSVLEEPFDAVVARGRMRCTKSGGIYGHSKNGLYSPLCHRYQRQRDFLYLTSLWIHGWDASSTPPASRRYGVSLHHGNLFGALRFGAELLWETDGDFDLISFHDGHDAMMERWQGFIQFVTAHGFETKVPYPEKPWYVNFLRDKTDFQMNVRGVRSELTRGRPPHIHNVSVYYQGHRAYVNGFQNPWQGIRADPGHDYRRRYLTQQGWVLAFTKKAISCKVPGHPSCLPPCGDPTLQSQHQFCDETWLLKAETALGAGPRPLDVYPSHLRDPILFV